MEEGAVVCAAAKERRSRRASGRSSMMVTGPPVPHQLTRCLQFGKKTIRTHNNGTISRKTPDPAPDGPCITPWNKHSGQNPTKNVVFINSSQLEGKCPRLLVKFSPALVPGSERLANSRVPGVLQGQHVAMGSSIMSLVAP